MWASGTECLDRRKALFKGKTTGAGFLWFALASALGFGEEQPSPAPTARKRFRVSCDPKSTTQKKGREGKGRLRLAEHVARADVPWAGGNILF